MARVTVKCTHCKTEFTKYASTVGSNNFCSKTCKYAHFSERRGEEHPQYTSVIVHCATCNAELVRPPARLKLSKNHFCNQECYGKWRKGKVFFETLPHVSVICDGCGEQFVLPSYEASATKTHYCSKECKDKCVNVKIELTCEYCHVKFLRPAYQKRRKHDFCCPEHGYAWRSENKESEFRYMRKGTVVHCANCDAELIRPPSRTDNYEKQFCNMKCQGEWISKNAVGENALRWAGGNIKVNCAQCGAELERPMNAIKRSKKHFCDIYCRGDWQSEHQTGEAHPLWTGGYKNYYGPNWSKQRQAARERDNHTCQQCGKTRDEVGKELDVHHIIPFRKFKYKAGENDNYLQANQLDNLMTLCPSCHSKDKGQKNRR